MLLAAEVETLQPSLISSLKPTKMVSCGNRFNKYVDDVDRLKKVNNKDYCTPPKQKKHKNMSLQKKGVAFSSRKALVLLSVHVSEVANGKLLLAAWWRCVDEWGPVVIVTPPTTNMSPKKGSTRVDTFKSGISTICCSVELPDSKNKGSNCHHYGENNRFHH